MPVFAFAGPPHSTGGIEGRVIDALTGKGVEGAAVQLHREGPQPGPRFIKATAGPGGVYKIGGALAGPYSLTCEKPGFSKPLPVQRTGISPLRVNPGSTFRGADCSMYPLAAVSGRVTDAGGVPVDGSTVKVYQRISRNGLIQWQDAGFATTSIGGDYRVGSLSPGVYIVHASKSSRRTSRPTLNAAFYPSAAAHEEAVQLELQDGREFRRADIRLRPIPCFSISGRVLLAGEPPPKTVLVAHERGAFDVYPRPASVTAPGGSFVLADVPAGSYFLSASAEIGLGPSEGRSQSGLPLEVHSDLRNVIIDLRDTLTVSGTLSFSGLGRAPRHDQASIHLRCVDWRVFPDVPASTFTSLGAHWKIDTRRPCRFVPELSMPIEIPGSPYISSIIIGGRDHLGEAIDLAQGPVGGVIIVVSTNTGGLSGTVVSGANMDDTFWISILARPEDSRRLRASGIFSSSYGVGTGRTLSGLPPGEYSVVAVSDADPKLVGDPDIWEKLRPHAVKVRVDPKRVTNYGRLKAVHWPGREPRR